MMQKLDNTASSHPHPHLHHPSRERLTEFCASYPLYKSSSAAVFAVYSDIELVKRWPIHSLIDVKEAQSYAILAKDPINEVCMHVSSPLHCAHR